MEPLFMDFPLTYWGGMNLSHITDHQLHIDTLDLVKQERELTTVILHHLREIDRRKLFSDYRCSSLYDYCVKVLGYSEASAARRIQAARLLHDLPELEGKIESGVLNLTSVSKVTSFFRQEDIKSVEEKRQVLKMVEGMSSRDCEKALIVLSGREIPAKEEQRRISQDKLKVTMILTDETVMLLDRVRGLIPKPLSNDELIGKLATVAIVRLTKKKFGTDVSDEFLR